jgi:hypothetical protein
MSEHDPVLSEWEAAEAAAGHPLSFVQLTVVAFNGLLGLDDRMRAHLTEARCPQCEEHLVRIWGGDCPPADVLEDAHDLSPQSTLRAAIATHAATCVDEACQSFRAAPAGRSKPFRVRAGELVAEVGATLVQVLFPDQPVAPILSTGDHPDIQSRAAESGSFGPVRLTALPEGVVEIEVDFDRLVALLGHQGVFLVLRQDDDHPLATVNLDGVRGRRRQAVDLHPEVLSDKTLRVVVGRLDV